MYNTKFLFTYKLHDDEEDQDTLYRHEYLYAFGIKEYDSDIIMKTLEYIYEKLKDNPDFIEILESHPHYNSNNKNHEIILQFLFSFHTLHVFHPCLVYLLSDDSTVTSDVKCSENFIRHKKILIDELKTKYY
jgi:hypothetical protein